MNPKPPVTRMYEFSTGSLRSSSSRLSNRRDDSVAGVSTESGESLSTGVLVSDLRRLSITGK